MGYPRVFSVDCAVNICSYNIHLFTMLDTPFSETPGIVRRIPPVGGCILLVRKALFTRRYTMHRQWSVQRTEVCYRDGQNRWDQVYQCLLQWAQEVHPQEEDHGRRPLRSGIDPAPATSSDD